LHSPFIVNSFLYDQYQLEKDGIPGKPKNKAETEYDESFRNLTSTWSRIDVPVSPGIDRAAVLPGCHKHCNTLTGTTWATLTVDGHSLQESVASWFFGDGTSPAYLEDSCDGYNCGPGCP
jgi:hypothetical protein